MIARSCLLRVSSLSLRSKTVLFDSIPALRLSSAMLQPDEGKNKLAYNSYTQKLTSWMQYYEDFVGLTEVKEAQGKVINAEQKFTDTQEKRREQQQRIQQLQIKLKEIHAELDKTSRGEDRYLHLLTQEHAIIREEKLLLENFQFLEKAEREYFSALSLAVRESHEKERAQAEKTKYWSIIGSICGAVIGIVGTSINNRLRMKELRGLVTESADHGQVRDLVNDLMSAVQTQQQQVVGFISDLKKLLGSWDESKHVDLVKHFGTSGAVDKSVERVEMQTSDLMKRMEQREERLAKEMKDVKALVAAQLVDRGARENYELPAVYVGEDVEGIVKKAEKNLEWRMKINSLATVTLVYGVLAIVLPFIREMFKGS